MKAIEKASAAERNRAAILRGASISEAAEAHGFYFVQAFDKDGNLKWEDTIDNVVCTEGKNANLTHFLKGSSYTAAQAMGLISSTSYTTPPAAGNTAANITTASGTPTNGWNEAPDTAAATRGTPAFDTAAAGALSLSTPTQFSILDTITIKGCFLLVRSAAGTAPTTTVGNTNGALWSAGLFTNGDKSLGNGDTLNVSYQTSL